MSNPFARLQELSTRLNQSSDALNKSVEQIETQFAALRLGISVWVDKPFLKRSLIDEKGGAPYDEEFYFGYAKREDGKWGLCIQKFYPGPDHADIIPFLQASRSSRLKALEQLPALIKQFEKEAEAAIKEVEKVQKIVDSEIRAKVPVPHEL
jgi:hypothetical protein